MAEGKCEICGVVYFTSGANNKAIGCTGNKETCPHSPSRKKQGKTEKIGDRSTGKNNTFSEDKIEGTK